MFEQNWAFFVKNQAYFKHGRPEPPFNIIFSKYFNHFEQNYEDLTFFYIFTNKQVHRISIAKTMLFKTELRKVYLHWLLKTKYKQ